MSKKKVLFLDFDGPLFPNRIINFHPANRRKYPGKLSVDTTMEKCTYWKMDEAAVGMLNSLYEMYPFCTVISSSWKGFCSKEFIEELFNINGLMLDLHKDWHTDRLTFRSCKRIEEITDWIEEHPEYDDYIVIDDPWSGESICTYKEYREESIIPKDNIIIIDPTIGLEWGHYTQMHKVVERWTGVTKEQQIKEEEKTKALYMALIV